MRQFPVGIVTLLFTDIEGSTRLLQRLGTRYAEVLRESRRLLRSAFQQRDGYEVDTQGDAFFVVFERATDAVMAAVTAQQAFFKAYWPDDANVRVRMGVHTGEPQAVEDGYIGLDVHRAARIMSAAHGGQVLLSDATRDLVASELPEEVGLQELGEYQLKDIAGHTQLFQLVIQDLPSTFPPPSTPGSLRPLRGIPFSSASFVGREQEIATLCNQLRRPDVRLLTLIGTGGVGKTRLALQVAAALEKQFIERVCFVALEHVKEKDEVTSALAQALSILEGKETSLLEQVKAVLRERPILLVLDNFEQVLSARLTIAELLASCPDLKVLVTSREMLHIRAEHLFEVTPLPLPTFEQKTDLPALSRSAAVALFVQRVQAVRPDFQLTSAQAADIVEICTRLEGIPLAIELAAAQTRYFSLPSLLDRLGHGTIFLRGKALDVPERQQTLRNALAWSYHLLAPDEQSVFRRAAVCAGGITLEAAEQICTAAGVLERDISEVLGDLVDKSMLRRQENEPGGTRFWLLQSLREYGLECLTVSGELRATQMAQSEYILAWVEQIAPLLAGAEQVSWLDRLDREYENVRVALAWMLDEVPREITRVEQALRLGIALMRFWETRCYFEEGSAFWEKALAESQGVSPGVKAQALHSAGFLSLMRGETARAETFLRESQLLFRENGDKAAMANILRLQGNLAMVKNTYKVARRLLEEALTIDQESGNIPRAASTRGALAQLAIAQGSYQQALALLEENLVLYEALGEHYSTAYPLYYMAVALFLSCQDQTEASGLVKEGLDLFRAVGNKRLIAHTLDLQGQILAAEHKDENALALLKESSELFNEIGDRSGRAKALMSRARLANSREKWEEARSFYEECWKMLREMGVKEQAAACLEGYGETLVARDAARQAVQFWGTAATIRATIVSPMPPVYRASYIRAVASAREHLGEERFQAAWMEGTRTTLEQVTLTR